MAKRKADPRAFSSVVFDGVKQTPSRANIIVKITTIDGNTIATMDIPEQSTVDLPLHDVRLELPKVHFELLAEPNLAVLDGALKPDGTIAGTFTQSGVEGTFVLVPQEAASAATPTPSGMVVGKIDVGGYKLFSTCRGQGSPALILEAGGGSTSSSWSKVMDGVSGTTRVCAYDRANLGHSDKAPTPRTYQDMVRDLHALLPSSSPDEVSRSRVSQGRQRR